MEHAGNCKNAYENKFEEPQRGSRLEDPGVNERTFKGMRGLDPSGSGSVLGERHSEYVHKPHTIFSQKVWRTVLWLRRLDAGL